METNKAHPEVRFIRPILKNTPLTPIFTQSGAFFTNPETPIRLPIAKSAQPQAIFTRPKAIFTRPEVFFIGPRSKLEGYIANNAKLAGTSERTGIKKKPTEAFMNDYFPNKNTKGTSNRFAQLPSEWSAPG